MAKRTPLVARERVAVMLQRGVSAAGRRVLAEEYCVTARTQGNWRRAPAGRWGRPPRPEALVEAARADCHCELLARGYGRWWKTIWERLGGKYTQALVREVVTELKSEHKALKRLIRALRRVSVNVSLRDVLWALDETHLGRLQDGAAVAGLVVREVASTRTLIVSVGSAATAEDLIRVLEALRLARGSLPLVICMDNGPAMKSELVAMYLAFHEVVALHNLPYVSEHNPCVERGHRDIKELSGLGKGVVLHDHAEAARALVPALAELNGCRPVASRDWRTPEAVDNEAARWYPAVDRSTFFGTVCQAVREAEQGCRNDRERRKAKREAILQTLEDFALAQRTRGGAPSAP